MKMLGARLAAKMVELEATDAEVAELADTDAKTVKAWREGKTDIDALSAIRLRPFLSEGIAGAAALNYVRGQAVPGGIGSMGGIGRVSA